MIDCLSLRSIFDFDAKQEKLQEVNLELEQPEIWQNAEKAKKLNQDKKKLEIVVLAIIKLEQELNEELELVELAELEQDLSLIEGATLRIANLSAAITKIELQRMFRGQSDNSSAFLDLQSGSGGTEAQDWAEMLLRMYLRFGESKGFKITIIEKSYGDVAGIKSATIKLEGEFAFGWLKSETGVHRLVRKSPFDSGNRRHTSFASVFVYPEVDDEIEVAINPAELRVDTYRASGAGGQHVNTTESAVRLTHIPTGIVAQCQNDRSQHKNKAQAMQQLKAKLYELELKKQNATKQELESDKSDIGWGSQIRSYVLDQSRVKDLRTGVEITDTVAVLDGKIEKFLIASLKEGVSNV